VPTDELEGEFDIDQAAIWPADDARLEPILLGGLPWQDLAEVAELDPDRSDAAEAMPAAPDPAGSAIGVVGSFGIHLATLLVLLVSWSEPVAEIPDAMPVQLVLEAPASGSAPEANPPPELPAPEVEAPSPNPVQSARQAAAAPPLPPAKPAVIAPHPTKPVPVPEPSPRPVTATAPPIPAPPSQTAPALTATVEASAQEAPTVEQDTARSDYFARLVTLTRGHLDLLPVSFLAGRRGQTILSVAISGDGTIGRIAVKRSSGYADIDTRIEQMVAAVGRFPPPPGWLRQPIVELDFNLTFPEALQHY